MTAYLDHAATTPMRPGAIDAMVDEMSRVGNTSSLHTSGRRARRTVEEAREQVAAAFGAGPSEVIFTSGGTEADNLAVKGLYRARRAGDPARRRIVVGATEHHAVLDAVDWLADAEGAVVVRLPVDAAGRIELAALEHELATGAATVALVSVMWANNEVGTVQPVAEVVELAHAHGVPVHTDAVQAAGQLPLDFAAVGADVLTVSGHKFGGPGGAAALIARRGLDLVPLFHGGGQERGLRSGTLDAPAIRAFAAAAAEAVAGLPAEATRLASLRDQVVSAVLSEVPDAILRGAAPGPDRLPNNAHFTFPGCEGDSLLYLLDARGVECSTGSACHAGVPQPSHVLLAMGVPEVVARGALRFSLGHTSTEQDVKELAEVIGPAIRRARGAGLTGVTDTDTTDAARPAASSKVRR